MSYAFLFKVVMLLAVSVFYVHQFVESDGFSSSNPWSKYIAYAAPFLLSIILWYSSLILPLEEPQVRDQDNSLSTFLWVVIFLSAALLFSAFVASSWQSWSTNKDVVIRNLWFFAPCLSVVALLLIRTIWPYEPWPFTGFVALANLTNFVLILGLLISGWKVVSANEGIQFVDLFRLGYHLLILAVVLQLWAGYIGTPAEKLGTLAGQANNPVKNLILVVHGLGGPDSTTELIDYLKTLEEFPDSQTRIVPVNYAMTSQWGIGNFANAFSNVDGVKLAERIEAEIEQQFKRSCSEGETPKVYLVGHSMGSVLARKAFLVGANFNKAAPNQNRPAHWTENVERIVLLAGLNRGISFDGNRPTDMAPAKHFGLWFAAYLGDHFHIGRLGQGLESGAPFISNLRNDWLEYCESNEPPEVVQVRGDIDDIVSEEDSHDIAANTGIFTSLTIIGTGHSDIVKLDIPDGFKEGETKRSSEPTTMSWVDIIRLRREEIKEAFLPTRAIELCEYERQVAAQDCPTKDVVIILHGIRDLGRWGASFERCLKQSNDNLDDKLDLEIEIPRYGYFGMGPFLVGSEREKHVKWFMDQLIEIKARHPNARFHFVGHSNGTYLLTKALKAYDSLRLNTVVLTGSVTDSKFEWNKYIENKRVKRLLNVTADGDWVVALFPGAYEWLPTDNPIGGAGYWGIDGVESNVPIQGDHFAFQKIVPEISQYVIDCAVEDRDRKGDETANPLESFVGSVEAVKAKPLDYPWLAFLAGPLVFLFILAVVLFLGIQIVAPARQYSVQVGIVYVVLVVWILHRI